MLHKSKSKKINQLKYALVIPILVLFLMGFNTEEVYIRNLNPTNQNPEKSNAIETSKKIISEDYYAVITKDFTDDDFKRIIGEAQEQGIKLTFTNIKRNDKNEITSINAAFTNENGSGTFNLNGKEPIKSFAYTQNEQGFGFHPLWQTNIVTDHLQVIGYDKKNVNTSHIIVGAVSNANGTTPLIIIDGKEMPNKKINDVIDQDNIYSINVLKGESAKNLYGEKGKDGVIEITSKEKSKIFEGKPMNNIKVVGFGAKPDSTITIKIGNNNPLVIVDGKEIVNESEKISPENVETIDVLKEQTATKKYGDKGKNGVIEITTKK